jgi:hypothetical protein
MVFGFVMTIIMNIFIAISYYYQAGVIKVPI